MERYVGYTQSARFTCLEDLELDNQFSLTSAISLDYCGCERCEKSYKFGPYKRENYVIHIIYEGKGSYTVGDQVFQLEKGQAFIIYPEIETLYRADIIEPWCYAWVGFHGYRSEEFIKKMGFSKEKPIIHLKHVEQEKACIINMLKAKRLTSIDELRRISELFELFALMMENNENYAGKENHDYPSATYVKYAMDYMRLNIKEKIKIDELADTIGISRSHLTGSFKKELNMSPQEYLIHLRLENATYLLKNTTKPIRIVASESGYEDSFFFSKIFKQKYNISPKAYRAMQVEVIQTDKKGKFEAKHL
ncbi:AraC-like protein [Lachnotalea glycerini]|uniref:AraC family transcriptional regulator n=1 Tax=Lachnotalea glycerini TaxID=1763509 RepID=A0A255HYM6_9FIRM|nr:AraC family transcriptional regulator [Lachnotalea glycerini]OYP09276.1 AraC family transcriptional regulator [Lachnotalea glycerini]PXV86680.1 AraC-like protein [Lachnotalea glycerini]RDY32182.1 AraC family transcriptional regulator [Lachnotalea glycerini]